MSKVNKCYNEITNKKLTITKIIVYILVIISFIFNLLINEGDFKIIQS